MRRPQSVSRFFAKIGRKFRKIDFLVNAAGIAQPLRSVEKISDDLWHNVLETNLNGAFFVTRAGLPLMRGGGAIVNVSSGAAYAAFPQFAAYNASKAGLLAFSNTLREELREKGIRVIALVPGATDTEIWQQFWPDAPRKRMIAPESLAIMVADALALPPSASVDELRINPATGAL